MECRIHFRPCACGLVVRLVLRTSAMSGSSYFNPFGLIVDAFGIQGVSVECRQLWLNCEGFSEAYRVFHGLGARQVAGGP